MAAPQAAGGLALILSAAIQSSLSTDRIPITQAVYAGAKPIAHLSWIEQGRGLMNVPAAYASLKKLEGKLAVEYSLSINSPTSPTGNGQGILVRSRQNPSNSFTVAVTPELPKNAPALFLRTFSLKPSASWIKLPASFWIHGSERAFQVDIDYSALEQAGLYSEKIVAIDESTNEIAFEIPVTVVKPSRLSDENAFHVEREITVPVGKTNRYFFDFPAGTTAVQASVISDGPRIWGQLLDPNGQEVFRIADGSITPPQPPIHAQGEISRGGVYELDIVAPAYNQRTAKVKLKIQLFSLTTQLEPALEPNQQEILVQNNFAPLKITGQTAINLVQKNP